jgi:PAS domain S-box-containing protein
LEKRVVHRIVRINYAIRAVAFAWTFFVLGIHGAHHGYGELYWILLALAFLLYPHAEYVIASRSADPKRTEIFFMYVDAALLGAWAGGLQFPLWITYALFFSTALAMAGLGEGYAAPTSDLVTALCFFGSVAYSCAIGWVMHEQNRGLMEARGALHESEARYRLIAENAAELIALVDESGRWVYTSPSFERLLDRDDLEPGTDALRRVHPDDADRVRMAIVRSAAMGKPQELTLRMIDRTESVRTLEARMHAITRPVSGADAITPELKKVVIVADEVPKAPEEEERPAVGGTVSA